MYVRYIWWRKYEDAIKEAELAVKIEKGILGQEAEEVEKAQEVLNTISKNYLKKM